jgi:hypothetical protein
MPDRERAIRVSGGQVSARAIMIIHYSVISLKIHPLAPFKALAGGYPAALEKIHIYKLLLM